MGIPQKDLPAGITAVRVLVRPMNEQVPVVPDPPFAGNDQTLEKVDRPNLAPSTAFGVDGGREAARRRIIAAIGAGSAACDRQEAQQDESGKQMAGPKGPPVEECGRYWDRTSDLCRVKAALSR